MSISSIKKAKNRETRHREAFLRSVNREYNILIAKQKQEQGLADERLTGTNEFGNKYGNGRIADPTSTMMVR